MKNAKSTCERKPIYIDFGNVRIENIMMDNDIPINIIGKSKYEHVTYNTSKLTLYLDNEKMFSQLWETNYFTIMTKWSLKRISHFFNKRNICNPLADACREIVDNGFKHPIVEDMTQEVAMLIWEMLSSSENLTNNPYMYFENGRIQFKEYEKECALFARGNCKECDSCKYKLAGKCENGIMTVTYVGKIINCVKRCMDRHGTSLIDPIAKPKNEYNTSAELAYFTKSANDTECSFLMCDLIAYVREHANVKNQDDIIRLIKARSLGFKIVDIVSHLAQGDEQAEKVLKDRYKYISKLTHKLCDSFKAEYPEYFELRG